MLERDTPGKELAPAQSPATVRNMDTEHELQYVYARAVWCSCGERFAGRTRSVAVQLLAAHLDRVGAAA